MKIFMFPKTLVYQVLHAGCHIVVKMARKNVKDEIGSIYKLTKLSAHLMPTVSRTRESQEEFSSRYVCSMT